MTNPDEMAELAPLDSVPTLFALGDASGIGAADRSPELTRLFDAISVRSPRPVADIAARAGLSLDAVRALLGALELDGEVAERQKGWVRVVG